MNKEIEKHSQIITTAMQSILKNMEDMVFVKDMDLTYISASQSIVKLMGINDPIEVVGKTDAQLFDDEELIRRYTDDDRHLLASGEPLHAYIEPFLQDDGSRGYCQTSKFPLFDDSGSVIGLYGIARDVTWEYKAKLQYEQELRSLFELPQAALRAVLFDVNNWRVVDVRVADEAVCRMLNFKSVEEFVRDSMESVIDDERVKDFYCNFSKEHLQSVYESGKRRMSLEYRRKLSNETIRWVQNDIYFISDPVNGNLCVMSILLDIDKEKQAARALARAAKRDALTNVYNRETTMAQINRFLSEEGKAGTHFLFMIDVDNFKLVNDTFGHQTGDKTLIHIASAIQKIFTPPDIVGRIGGDEFFALMKNADSPSAAGERAVELVQALQYECREGAANVEISGSVGISSYLGDGKKNVDQLYAEADAALYKAKQTGKNRYVFAAETTDTGKNREPLSTVNLRTLLENMDAAMFQTEIDSDGNICVTYSSHSLFSEQKQNIECSGARGEDIWNVILPEDLKHLKAEILEAANNRSNLECICRVRNSMRRIEWRHIRGTQLPDQEDGIRRMIHVAIDITKQKQTEDELREKNSVIDLAMRNSDINLWYYDCETKKCQMTKSCQVAHNMQGIEELENFPESLFKMGYVREDNIDFIREQYASMRRTGENVEFDAWYKKGDSNDWWCERHILLPLAKSDGKVTRVIGIGKNVTSEKLLEEKYETFGAYRRLAEKNTRVSFRMNLTTGWFGDCISSTQAVRQLYQVNTVDEFFEKLRERVVSEADIANFDSVLTRERLLEAFLGGDSLRGIECHFRNEENHIIWLKITVEMMKNPVTSEVEALLYSFDIDHEKNMRFLVDKLLEVDYEFLGLIDVSTGRLMAFGIVEALEMAQNGCMYEEEMRRVFRGLILNEYYEEGIRTMSIAHVVQALESKDYYTCSFPARDFAHTRAGRKQWKFVYLDESKSKILISRTDITSLYTAEYDSLTGLYNRETFYGHVRELLDANPFRHFILIRFDIDRFKAYNDVYGTQAGDRLLAAAGKAARLKDWPELTLFGRLEADHFVLVMPLGDFNIDSFSTDHIKWLESVAEGYRLTSSVGIYDITDPSLEVSLMCDRALLALRTVKDSYTRKIAWYNESLREKLMQEQALADDMEQALLEEQFVLYFQPLINYDDSSLIGAEALVRWRHPKRGLIPPGEFISLFEKNGFILKLDAFVWEKSCQYLRRWMDEGKNPVPVSVNVSRCDLYDPDLNKRFEVLLDKYQIPYSLLKLEITESAYMDDPDQLVVIVGQLRAMGFTVEMDDFGTGYSSLNMLKDMPVDILKLDTRFISESENDTRAITILSAIIRMAHRLGLSIIAEGVETKVQAESLKDLNCTNMQGYYFGRPMPAEEFEQILNRESNKKNY